MKKIIIIIILILAVFKNVTVGLKKEIIKKNTIKSYNQGYRAGLLYAYDSILLCEVNIENESKKLSKTMYQLNEIDNPLISNITCRE